MTFEFDFGGEAPAPRDAATVLLLRDRPARGGGPEVFFVKRNAGARFMGGAYVFPGGRVDPSDADETVPGDLTAAEASQRLGEPDAVRARALFVAALRECLEESGVLIATPAVTVSVAASLRMALAAKDGPGLRALLTEARVSLCLSALIPLSRWVTPKAESRRFDARFFLARCPDDVGAVHDGGETVASLWLTAREALERARRHEIVLAPPTWCTLETLAAAESVDEVLDAPRRSLDPIEPWVAMQNDQPVVVMPDSPHAPVKRFGYNDGAWIPVG